MVLWDTPVALFFSGRPLLARLAQDYCHANDKVEGDLGAVWREETEEMATAVLDGVSDHQRYAEASQRWEHSFHVI